MNTRKFVVALIVSAMVAWPISGFLYGFISIPPDDLRLGQQIYWGIIGLAASIHDLPSIMLDHEMVVWWTRSFPLVLIAAITWVIVASKMLTDFNDRSKP